MRDVDAKFLIGLVLLSVMSMIVSLLFPSNWEESFLPIIKLAVAIFIFHYFALLLGHSLF